MISLLLLKVHSTLFLILIIFLLSEITPTHGNECLKSMGVFNRDNNFISHDQNYNPRELAVQAGINFPTTFRFAVTSKVSISGVRSRGVFSPSQNSDLSRYGVALMEAVFSHPYTLDKNRRILILGSGVGLDATALTKMTNAQVTATDISINSLRVAKINSKIHGVEDQVNYIHSDLLDSVSGQYDLIIFNAPRVITPEVFKKQGLPEEKINKIMTDLKNGPNDLYDYKGVLFERLMRDLPVKTTSSGRLLIMADEHIQVHVPKLYGVKSLSKPLLWDLKNTKDHHFRIFEISPRI